ncbi:MULTISPECIES: DUF4238 domain-containing protein [unclassified Afipia]|uniref:DUF4238 domain-containing protein n=1 Tax=unclassified Afipia TaxID=2642050 RepID=UPI0009DEC85F|nr:MULTISPECIES: DUF4238 domain-containing protein [unclassified Afipia]MBQ8101288.1 DUF4238 domain-containing protein [Afipia sp.]
MKTKVGQGLPNQKNQHYVPRCLLKPFTLNGQGHALNVVNIDRQKAIERAPVKGQCARDYLYGKDLRAENILMGLEGHFARIARYLSTGKDLSKDDVGWLRVFLAVQSRRTVQAIEEIRIARKQMEDVTYAAHPEQRPPDLSTDAQVMIFSLKLGLDLAKYLDDLKPVVLRNNTNRDFVIGDHPSLLVNKFANERRGENKFGVASSGAIFTMPLSPRLSFLLFDSQVYTVPNISGTAFVELKNSSDVSALNELQILSAGHNFYFSDWAKRDVALDELGRLTTKRALPRSGPLVLIRDTDKPNEEVYREGTPSEILKARERLIGTSFWHPTPSRWPSVIKYRKKPIIFDSGSMAGALRKPEWLRGRQDTR